MCWTCEHPGSDYVTEVVRPIIQRHGWFVQYVEPGGPHAALAYTIGLLEHGLPELVVTGLSPVGSAAVLNRAGDELHHRELPEPGQRLELDGQLLEVVAVTHPDAHLMTLVQCYGPDVSALQLVHDDERGAWPWSRGYRSGRGGQPVLGPRARSRAGADR